jgi:Serine hydrolase (FSH1)
MASHLHHKQGDNNLHLPRILCLHGGGTNARIFRAQCRTIQKFLDSSFRLVFAEAPFPSKAGPDVLSVYRKYGPFKCWLPWSATNHTEINPYFAIDMLDDSLNAATEEDNRAGATGPWVGLLGFSQGAKMCASLLYRQQKLAAHHPDGLRWRFAVLIAGRGPLIDLGPASPMTEEAVSQIQIKNSLYLPTIHVHGRQDPGLPEHQKLLAEWCVEGKTRLMEWDGNHRVPIKTRDVSDLVMHIQQVVYELGLLSDNPAQKYPSLLQMNASPPGHDFGNYE